jgi:hypothetical protein
MNAAAMDSLNKLVCLLAPRKRGWSSRERALYESVARAISAARSARASAADTAAKESSS